MVTMTIYANTDVFCWIVNSLRGSIKCEWDDVKEVSLKKTKDYPFEIQVPIEIIDQLIKKNRTTINLFKRYYSFIFCSNCELFF
jgi:hypothetical protein